jgi:hypothetical protein
MEFRINLATNYLVLTYYTNVSYIVGHKRESSSVYRVYFVGNDNILMCISEEQCTRTIQKRRYITDCLCVPYVGDGVKHASDVSFDNM